MNHYKPPCASFSRFMDTDFSFLCFLSFSRFFSSNVAAMMVVLRSNFLLGSSSSALFNLRQHMVVGGAIGCKATQPTNQMFRWVPKWWTLDAGNLEFNTSISYISRINISLCHFSNRHKPLNQIDSFTMSLLNGWS